MQAQKWIFRALLAESLIAASVLWMSACGSDKPTAAAEPNLGGAGTQSTSNASTMTTTSAAGSTAPTTTAGANTAAGTSAARPTTAGTSAAAGSGGDASASKPATNGGSVVPGGSAGMDAAGSGAAGMDTSTATAGTGGPTTTGGGPKGEPVNTDQKGPHQFDKYTMGLDNPTYASSVMYYPTDATPPYGAVVFSPGFTATKENYENFLGPLLASHGICILLTTPTTTGDQPQQRGQDLQAAVMQIGKENTREGSPLKGKLDPERVCVTGHSMGGGGTLWAATALGDKIKCAVPLQPWQPGQSFSMIKAPTMFIAAQNDTIAGVAQNASVFYASIPATVEKYYVEFAGADHFLTTNDLGKAYDVQSKYMISFYKLMLEDDQRYRDVLNAPKDAALSKYEHTGPKM